MLFRTVLSRSPTPPLPQDWGFATPENAITIISGTGKATDLNFVLTFKGLIGTKLSEEEEHMTSV